jgi:Tol biopolymer transport system component
MNQRDDLDRKLMAWLDDPFTPPAPAYLGQVLERTRRTRQRRSWASLERWLPMTITLRRPMLAPSMRLLAVGLALLLALLAAMALAPILSQPSRLAATVMNTSNGLIAYDAIGDIWVLDPADGQHHVLIGGPETDSEPVWSPDGTRIMFWREGDAHGLMAASADGTSVIKVAPDSGEIHRWSPDGSRIAVSLEDNGRSSIAIAKGDGSGVETLDLGMNADMPSWHPDGARLLFRGTTDAGVPGLYTVDLASHAVTGPLVTMDPTSPLLAKWGWQSFFDGATYSPDGTAILYSTVVDLVPGQIPDGQSARARMMNADGSNDHEVAFASDSAYETALGWSPDGKRYALRVEGGGPEVTSLEDNPVSIAVVTLGDPAATVTSPPATAHAVSSTWAPDGSAILSWGGLRAEIIDADTGGSSPLTVGFSGNADWQPVPSGS